MANWCDAANLFPTEKNNSCWKKKPCAANESPQQISTKLWHSFGPTQDRNGITGTEDSQATCTQAGTTPSAAGTIVFYIYGPIFLPDLQPSDKGAEPSTEIQCKSLPGTKLTDVKK